MKKLYLYIGGFELPDKNAAAFRVKSIGKILESIGFEVALIGVNKGLEYGVSIDKTFYKHDDFDVWEVPYPRSTIQWLMYITSVKEIISIIEKKYNYKLAGVICYNYPAFAQYRLHKFCKKNKIKLISDVTEWYSAKGYSYLKSLIKLFDVYVRMNYVNNQSDGVITTSEYVTKFYKNKNKNKNKNIVEVPTLFENICMDMRAETNRFSKKLLYAGNPFDINNAKKNRKSVKERLDLIIELVNNLVSEGVNVEIDIFGVTKLDYLSIYPEHTSIVEKLNSTIFFHGKTEHGVVVKYIKCADYTIFLRDKTRVNLAGFPSKFSESISLGTPVLTNKLPNVEKYMEEGVHGFFIDHKDSQKMLQSTINALFNTDIKRMKKNCLQSELFSYKKYVDLLTNFMINVENGVSDNK